LTPTLYNTSRNIAPMGVAKIKAFLEENGSQVTTIDLTNSLFKLPERHELIKKWEVIFDREFFFSCLSQSCDFKKIEALFGPIIADLDIAQYDLIGISAGANSKMFELHATFLIGKYLSIKYQIPVVFGGINISIIYMFNNIYRDLWDLVLKNFKYFINGPGERPLQEIMEAIDKGNIDTEYYHIDGAIYCKDGMLVANEPASPTFTMPDFSGLDLSYYTTCVNVQDQRENEIFFYKWMMPFNIKVSKYNRKRNDIQKKEVLFIPYTFNYYCPYNCAFCEQSNEKKKMPLSISASQAFNDICFLQKKYDSNYFVFLNNTFNYKRSFVTEFCNLILDNNIEIYWSDCARFNGLTKELLVLMYKAGCRKLVFGIESASPKILKYVNKKLDLELAESVLTWCYEIGIWAELEVIVGLPFEIEEDFQATYRFLIKNKEKINFFHLNCFYIYPGSLIDVYPEKYGIERLDTSDYDTILKNDKEVYFNQGDVNVNISPLYVNTFNEIGGRNYQQIVAETSAKHKRMIDLLHSFPVFAEVSDFFSTLNKKPHF